MTLKVCVGSSCHLKGSYEVIEKLKELIAECGKENEITLQASFCLGRCSTGVSAMMDDEFIDGLNGENVREIFEGTILPALNK